MRIEYEEMPAVFSLADSLAQKEIIWGETNVFKKFLVDKGNVDDGLVAGRSSSSKVNTRPARRNNSISRTTGLLRYQTPTTG